MNIYILHILSKFLSVVFVTALSLSGSTSVIKSNINMKVKSVIYENQIEKYTTSYQYDKSLPDDSETVKQKGINGLYYYNDKNEKIVVKKMQKEIIVKGSGAKGYFKGWTTGYGPDCKTCSGGGNVACRIKGKPFNLINDGIYYNDPKYGDVRVVAATKEVFPCGSIIYVDNKIQEPFYAIVLDRGAGIEYSYNVRGVVHIDIAFKTQKDQAVWSVTNTKLTAEINVLRWGF